jgi:hypothetical protein
MAVGAPVKKIWRFSQSNQLLSSLSQLILKKESPSK